MFCIHAKLSHVRQKTNKIQGVGSHCLLTNLLKYENKESYILEKRKTYNWY